MRVAIATIASTSFVAGHASAFVTSSSSLPLYRCARSSRSLSAAALRVDIDENAPRNVAAMEEWTLACGVERIEGFQLVGEAVDGHLDVSVVTTQNIAANTPILFVPGEMIFSSNKAVQEFGRLKDAEKVIAENNAESELRQYYLMLKILVEWERGEQSPWFSYLNSFPRYFSNAASMTPFGYKCVPAFLASLAQTERANLNHLSVKRINILSNDTKGRTDLWKWAFQIVYTRSFEANNGSDDLCLAPMLDTFNHGSTPNVEYAFDDNGNCHVQTTRDVGAGSALCLSYADPTNPSFLLARYGFLDETAPASFCKILPTHVNDEMRNLGYAYNKMLFYKDTGDVSPQVWDILLYQLLNENRPKQSEFYEAHMNGCDEIKQAIHEQYYPETLAKLLEHIDGFLQRLDDLSAKASERDVNEHPRLPVILRHNEFVKNTFLAVRSRYFE